MLFWKSNYKSKLFGIWTVLWPRDVYQIQMHMLSKMNVLVLVTLLLSFVIFCGKWLFLCSENFWKALEMSCFAFVYRNVFIYLTFKLIYVPVVYISNINIMDHWRDFLFPLHYNHNVVHHMVCIFADKRLLLCS